MLAIRIDRHGGPEVLTPVAVAEPSASPGQVLVRHEVIGVNFVDTQHRAGTPYPVEAPLVPGIEAAGRIVQADPAADGWAVGDRVAYAGPMVGVYAEIAAVEAHDLVAVPDALSLELAATSLLQGMTAHVVTHDVHECSPGQVALVHAAAGGTGSLVSQYLLRQGAAVIGTVSSEAKAAFLRDLGVAHVVNRHQEDVVAAVRRVAPAGADVVFDSVGAATFEVSLRAARAKGVIVAFGQSSGPVPPTDIARLSGLTGEGLPGSLWLTWPTLVDYNATPDDLARRAAAVFDAVAVGDIVPAVAESFPLARAADAHRLIESGTVIGKVLLEV